MTDDAQANAAVPFGGRYVLGDVLGSGGMSTVYRAHDQVLGRTIALKILASESSDPALMKREKTEVALLASLSHHALVTLYDANVAEVAGNDRSYLAMELVDGPTLDARRHEGPIAPVDMNKMLLDLAEALHVVHRAGVVHRDIKPGNILLAPTHLPGREFSAKLADFGIASLVDSTRVTATGTVIGTAAYLSPEQALGTRVGPPSDIYSLGLVLLEAHTGQREFPGTMIESLTARMNRDPVIPGNLGYEWKSLLTAMTSRDPDARPTAEQILERAQGFAITGSNPATATLTAPLLPATATTVPFEDATAVLTSRRAARNAAPPAPGRFSSRTLVFAIAGISVGIILLLVAVLVIAAHFTIPDPLTTPNPTDTSTPATTPAPTRIPTSTTAPTTVVPQPATTNPAPAATTAPAPAPVATTSPVAPVPAPTATTKTNNGNGNGNGNGKGGGNGKPKK